jgi:hypothetical protein
MLRLALIRNDNGYLAIVTAMLLLLLVTLIGLSASRVASTEAAMTRNEIIYKRNLYLAEGAAWEAADHLSRYNDLRENMPPWMEVASGNLNTDSLRFYWDNSLDSGDAVIPEPAKVDPDNTFFLVGHEGVARGSSLDLSKPSIHSLTIFGGCKWEGTSVIKIGYRKAY